MKLLSAIAVLASTLREAQRYNIYHVKETEPIEESAIAPILPLRIPIVL